LIFPAVRVRTPSFFCWSAQRAGQTEPSDAILEVVPPAKVTKTSRRSTRLIDEPFRELPVSSVSNSLTPCYSCDGLMAV
jgi:hypothetical protein